MSGVFPSWSEWAFALELAGWQMVILVCKVGPWLVWPVTTLVMSGWFRRSKDT